jgi:hypothetical protein
MSLRARSQTFNNNKNSIKINSFFEKLYYIIDINGEKKMAISLIADDLKTYLETYIYDVYVEEASKDGSLYLKYIFNQSADPDNIISNFHLSLHTGNESINQYEEVSSNNQQINTKSKNRKKKCVTKFILNF